MKNYLVQEKGGDTFTMLKIAWVLGFFSQLK